MSLRLVARLNVRHKNTLENNCLLDCFILLYMNFSTKAINIVFEFLQTCNFSYVPYISMNDYPIGKLFTEFNCATELQADTRLKIP